MIALWIFLNMLVGLFVWIAVDRDDKYLSWYHRMPNWAAIAVLPLLLSVWPLAFWYRYQTKRLRRGL